MKKILIIGGSGLLGRQLISDLSKSFAITATYYKHRFRVRNARLVYLDISNKEQIKKVINSDKWHLVLHAASLGDVDYCQKNKKNARIINVRATKQIAYLCEKNKTKLIYFSTNAIYDGKKGYYDEDSFPRPINYYGKTKLEGEECIEKSGVDYIILRLNTMYGFNSKEQRGNPAVWIINSLREGKTIKVVDDVYNSHLWVGFVSEVIKAISANDRLTRETFNVGGSDCINRYDFALTIGEIFGLNKNLIKKAKSSNFPSLAPRPKNTCFTTDKLVKVLRVKPMSLEQGLREMKKHEEYTR